MVCESGDDGNYGSSAMIDVQILQAMSKRIHYGKFVAETKYLSQQDKFKELILNKDRDGIWEVITDNAVEEKVLNRIMLKGSTYGQDPSFPKDSPNDDKKYFIDPSKIREIYEKIIIPMTKEVQVLYLLERMR